MVLFLRDPGRRSPGTGAADRRPRQTIYTRPANRIVAAFVGAPQSRAAEDARGAARRRPARWRAVEGDGWEGWCAGPQDLAAGEPVTVIVRPEASSSASRPATGITWNGTVVQRFFRGARNVYMVEVAAHRFTVDAPPDHPRVPGSEVTLSVDAAQTWIVRD